jgi:murein DD-endopeptidase MepM/ murein hydrolase activator NlpD
MGNYVIIHHDDTYDTFYSHLKSSSVKAGDNVKKGSVIGYVGSTGLSTGPHLHYEVIKNGERVNPEDYMPK